MSSNKTVNNVNHNLTQPQTISKNKLRKLHRHILGNERVQYHLNEVGKETVEHVDDELVDPGVIITTWS